MTDEDPAPAAEPTSPLWFVTAIVAVAVLLLFAQPTYVMLLERTGAGVDEICRAECSFRSGCGHASEICESQCWDRRARPE